jgi:predicted nucleic acid-binding protein
MPKTIPMIKNIHKQLPHNSDRFFIDANVWFWFTYASSNEMYKDEHSSRYQAHQYPEFIEKILDSGAKIFHCPLVFSELANVIERTEYEMEYPCRSITRKQFRAQTEKRARVISEIEMAWETIESISESLDIVLTNTNIKTALVLLKNSCLDPYDAFYCEMMEKEGIQNLVTDDADFQSIQSQNIYTANRKMI